MKAKIAALASTLLLSSPAPAAEKTELPQGEVKGVDAPLCKLISMHVVENAHANFDHFSPLRTGVFFTHPLAKDVVLDCSSRLFLSLYISTSSPYPNDLWFSFAAEAGRAISTTTAQVVEDALRRCHKQALADQSGIGMAQIPGAELDCQIWMDIPSFSVSVFLRDEINNKIFGDNLHQDQ